jgi:hypothetical protein
MEERNSVTPFGACGVCLLKEHHQSTNRHAVLFTIIFNQLMGARINSRD